MWIRATSAVLFLATGLSAQQAVIPDEPSCAQCTIALEKVVTLRTAHGPGSLVRSPKSVARNALGHYFVVDFGDRTSISVFGPDGVFLKRIGRQGDGPGEFTYLELVKILQGDSIAAVERHRIQILSPDGRYVRSFQLAGPKYDLTQSDGAFLLAGTVPSRERIGFPLHEIGPQGSFLRSFGVEEVFRPDRMDWGASVIAASQDGSAVSISKNQFVIDLWSREKVHLRRAIRATRWFPAQLHRDALPTRDTPRPPIVTGIQLNGGIPLVVISVPHERWRQIVPDEIEVSGGRVVPIDDGEGYFQTRIEALDLQENTLLAARRFDVESYGFAGKDIIYSLRANPDGTIDTDVWRVTLTR